MSIPVCPMCLSPVIRVEPNEAIDKYNRMITRVAELEAEHNELSEGNYDLGNEVSELKADVARFKKHGLNDCARADKAEAALKTALAGGNAEDPHLFDEFDAEMNRQWREDHRSENET